MNSPGFSAIRSPRKSRICVLAMRTAMPFVNPMTTGRGMKRTAVPVPVTPRTTSMTPAIIVHMNRPGDAVLGDDAGDDDDEGAGRAADLDARAAERRDEEAGDDRAVDAGLGREARGDRERHRERQRDEADGDAGDEIVPEGDAVVAAKREDRLRQPGGPLAGRERHVFIIAPSGDRGLIATC